VFSLVQLISSPFFGLLSDRIGRKPVLIISILGTAVGFFVIGLAQSAFMLFLGRIIDGASGGNVATAQACIADVTPPDKRSKAMGVIGAAFGLGFVMGPALGGWLAQYSSQLPFFFAGFLSLINGVLVAMLLPETYPKEHRLAGVRRSSLLDVFKNGRGALIALLLAASLLSTTGFAYIHVLFALFCKDRFSWDVRQTSMAFAYVGILAVLVQGGLLRRLLKKNIEKEVALLGAVLLAASLFWLPRVSGVGQFFWGSCALMALGNGLLTPTLSGLASRHVDGDVQGRLMGLMSMAGSLGRFLGPTLAMVPFPSDFTRLGRPLAEDILQIANAGYSRSFSQGAILILISFACILAVRIPVEITRDQAPEVPRPAGT
jgi:multidrug resistance protein